MNIVKMIADRIENKPLVSLDVKEEGKVYLHPSSAMVQTYDNKPLGACIRQVYFNKIGAKETNPVTSYNIMIQDSGNMWESWVIEKYKQLGIYLDNSIKLVDNIYNISCELDILHTNPELGTIEVTEVKSYAGHNYQATKEILGTDSQYPKPKDQNLLQVVKYLLVLKRYNIDRVNLLYIDRSSSSYWNNKQFILYLDGSDIYYKTLYKGEWVEIRETRFDTNSILEKDQALLQMLELKVAPPPDYHIQYTKDILEQEYLAGNVTKTNYQKVLKDEIDVSELCSFPCRYCRYSKNRDTGEATCLDYSD